jgi:hypothetical protein
MWIIALVMVNAAIVFYVAYKFDYAHTGCYLVFQSPSSSSSSSSFPTEVNETTLSNSEIESTSSHTPEDSFVVKGLIEVGSRPIPLHRGDSGDAYHDDNEGGRLVMFYYLLLFLERHICNVLCPRFADDTAPAGAVCCCCCCCCCRLLFVGYIYLFSLPYYQLFFFFFLAFFLLQVLGSRHSI